MQGKKITRTIITVGLVVALFSSIIVSQRYDPENPHSTIPQQEWLSGEKAHGDTVLNNQNPQKYCYQCHEKQGLGGQAYCQYCHDQSGVEFNFD